jgi:myosin heavy subunit
MAQQMLEKKINVLKEGIRSSSNKKSVVSAVRGRHGGDDGDNVIPRLRKKVHTLEDDIMRRQESYVQRARQDKQQIEILQREIDSHHTGRQKVVGEDMRMKIVKEMHQQIMKNVENVQSTTSRILQEQERDLLRAFRARLFDVQNELEKEKNKSEEGASLWIEKNRQLEKDLEWAKEMADRLERANQSLSRDNMTLKQQFKTQEDDREFLIKELVAVRKDNERLRHEVSSLKTNYSELNLKLGEKTFQDRQVDMLGGGAKIGAISNKVYDEESPKRYNKYKGIVNRMKSLLERERKNLRRARSEYEREVQQRSQLELFLRECVADVRKEISHRRKGLVGKSSQNATTSNLPSNHDNVSISDFTASDRERVMELLLSQERVINVLYSKTFLPPKEKSSNKLGSIDSPSLPTLKN